GIGLNLNFDSHLDDLNGGNTEIGRRTFSVALHEGVDRLTPYPHSRNALGRNNRLPSEVIRDFRRYAAIKMVFVMGLPNSLRNRRRLHETKMQDHARQSPRQL